MDISYTNEITVEDYNALRLSAGWHAIMPEQARAGLDGSAFVVAAKHGDIMVGVARLVWDGGAAALVKDVLVLPEYQGKGIGKHMMNALLSFLREKMKPGWAVSVDLMAATGKEGFYEKLGFAARPRDRRGAGMDMRIGGD